MTGVLLSSPYNHLSLPGIEYGCQRLKVSAYNQLVAGVASVDEPHDNPGLLRIVFQ